MRTAAAWPIAAFVALAWIGMAVAGDLKDEMKVQVQGAEMHSGMAPGTYVCAAGHFHVKGTVQNLAQVPVGQVKVEGKALDADGKVLGTASASTKQAVLNPNDKASVDLEFLTVTGALLDKVKSQEIAVVAVASKP
jgi:hypothetical protein